MTGILLGIRSGRIVERLIHILIDKTTALYRIAQVATKRLYRRENDPPIGRLHGNPVDVIKYTVTARVELRVQVVQIHYLQQDVPSEVRLWQIINICPG